MAARKRLGKVDEIIGLIYQGPLETRPWHSFLMALRLRLGCDVAAISLRLRRKEGVPINVYSRRDAIRDDELVERYKSLYGKIDPLGDALTSAGDIYTLDEVISREELIKTDYYKTMLAPFGLIHQLGMRISEPSGWKSNIGLMNSARRGNFGATEKAFFLEFRPHLERALEIFARIRRNEGEKQIFEETLDRLSIAAYILDGNGDIIEMNDAGRFIAAQGEGISLVQNRLALADAKNNERLTKVIRQALSCRDSDKTDSFVDALRIERRGGSNLSLLIRTVTTSYRYQSDVSPAVIVYACDPTQQELAPERSVAQLFGLSAAEAGLASLLASGMTLSQAAQKLGITENTARTYSKRMFEKAGVSRQTELVRLILTGVAPLGRK